MKTTQHKDGRTATVQPAVEKEQIQAIRACDVVVTKSKDPTWRKYCVMPMNNRTTQWVNSFQFALLVAQDLANQTGGKVIVKLGGGQ